MYLYTKGRRVMLNGKKPLNNALLIVTLIFLAAGAVINIQGIGSGFLISVGSIFTILALLAAFYYILRGFTKNQAWAYKTFVYCFLAVVLFELAILSEYEISAFTVIICAVSLVLITAAAFVKDLGETKSVVICSAIALIFIIELVQMLISLPAFLRSGSTVGTSLAIRAFSNLILSATFGLATIGKYFDKESRGTK